MTLTNTALVFCFCQIVPHSLLFSKFSSTVNQTSIKSLSYSCQIAFCQSFFWGIMLLAFFFFQIVTCSLPFLNLSSTGNQTLDLWEGYITTNLYSIFSVVWLVSMVGSSAWHSWQESSFGSGNLERVILGKTPVFKVSW